MAEEIVFCAPIHCPHNRGRTAVVELVSKRPQDLQQFGVYGATAITLLTVQNTQGVQQIQFHEPRIVMAQIRCVMDDISPIVKTGALGNAAIINAVAQWQKL